jgi:ferredoxin
MIQLILENCIGCGACVEKCPNCAIPDSLIGFISSLAKINEKKCDYCGDCIQICSHGAIKISKREIG